MAGRDITEGRSSRAIAVNLGVATGVTWQNNSNVYDCAIAGIPFIMAINDQRPFERATAPFRKQQFDSQRDPGEQSLSTWWLRSQSSFHAGMGINYYDPLANPYSTTLASNSYRFNDSLGVDVFTTPGQVSLLKRPALIQSTSTTRSITSVTIAGVDKILVQDGSTLKITDGTTSAMTTISGTVSTGILASCTDGKNAFYVDAAHVVMVPLTGGATSAVRNVSAPTTAHMAYVKQRLVVGINNALYEFPAVSGGTTLPTAVYTHPNTDWVWTSITEGGGAIYASGYSGSNSCIFKFTLDTTGAMPVLTSAITAAQLPEGEVVYSCYVHLSAYMLIGSNKGVRVGAIDNINGNVTYGPLVIHTEKPVRAFTARDSFVHCATTIDSVETNESNWVGTYVIDLSNEIDNLRFAYATHTYAEGTIGEAIDVCFLGRSDRLAFLAASTSATVQPVSTLGLWLESDTELYPSGWLQTGYIRYNTLEPKNFKRIYGHADVTYGSISIQTHTLDNTLYDVISYDAIVGSPEVTITQPIGSQDALGLRFIIYRDPIDSSKCAIFKGYQLKAVPATPRSRIIKVPLMCFDTETDKYNSTAGYEGRAFERLSALEHAEEQGDVVTWQDLRTGETQQCLIEELIFTDITPPDKKLTGFGGIISLTIRTV